MENRPKLIMKEDKNDLSKEDTNGNICFIMDKMRREGILTDAVIITLHKEFRVHRVVLSAASDYFRASFDNFGFGCFVPEENISRLELYDINTNTLEQCIEFAYTSKCNVSKENIHELLITADYLGMLPLLGLCENYLAEDVNTTNCVISWQFAKFRFLKKLEEVAYEFIQANFTELCMPYAPALLDLSGPELASVINDDFLNVPDEDVVWKLVMRWLQVDFERRRYLLKILKSIRLGLLSSTCFMEEVKRHPHVSTCMKVKPLVLEVFKFMYELNMIDPLAGPRETPLYARPRIPYNIIVTYGGWASGSAKDFMEAYDVRADRWVQLQPANDGGIRAYHGSAVLGKKLYIVGGYDGTDYFSSCRCFNFKTMSWCEVAPMNTQRCYVAVVALDGDMYAIGGYDGESRLNTVERYSPLYNHWSSVRSMHIPRSDASAAVFGGKLYVMGGFNGEECLSSVECYDPVEDRWEFIRNMNQRRSGFAAGTVDGLLYAVGGFNGIARLATAERYCPITKRWTFITEMSQCRSNFAMGSMENLLFAVGGFNGVSTIANVECYDPARNIWIEANHLHEVRSALTANCIEGLPNRVELIGENRENLVDERRQRILNATRNNFGPIPNSSGSSGSIPNSSGSSGSNINYLLNQAKKAQNAIDEDLLEDEDFQEQVEEIEATQSLTNLPEDENGPIADLANSQEIGNIGADISNLSINPDSEPDQGMDIDGYE